MTQLASSVPNAPSSAPSAASAPASATVGKWELVSLLGEGSMATVYQARPQSAGGRVAASYAIKILRPQWETHAQAVMQLKREVVVAQAVCHPHVVSVLDWSVEQPPYFVVMPLLRGATLAEHISGDHRRDLPAVLWIVRQTAQALAVLHSAGWMHSDVKPENIFVSHDGHATLLDLGYARQLGQAAHVGERTILGTLAYMAPELFVSALAPDERSDIYSLGVTLYHAVTGKLPFPGRNPAEVAKLHREGIPDHLRRLSSDLPPDLVRLLRSMLAKDPLRRPESAKKVVEELAALEIATFAQRGGWHAG